MKKINGLVLSALTAALLVGCGGGGGGSSGAPASVITASTISSYMDNVGIAQNASSIISMTDDTTPGFNIGALPSGVDSAVLYVDGVAVDSTYDSITGTLTPTTALVGGTYAITYAYKDSAGTIGTQGTAFNLGIILPSLRTISDSSTTDTTPGFDIGALPSGIVDVILYVNGVAVDSTYDSITGILTPTGALSTGANVITYAYEDSLENIITQSEPFNLNISATTTPTRIGGTVAIGTGVASQIQILDVPTCQVIPAISDSTGAWQSDDISSFEGPFILRATSPLGFTMYSFIDTSSGNSVANITPLTHYAIDNASRSSATTGIASTYASCNNGISSISALQTALNTTISILTSALSTAFPTNEFASSNPFTNAFTANHTGYDGLLDGMDIALNNNDTIIRLGNSILETLDEDITGETTQDISNTVKDSAGNLLDGVTVTIGLRNDNIDFTALTATTASGTYTLAVPKYREYEITYTKTGYTSVTQNYNSFEDIDPSNVIMFTETETANSTPVTPTLNITDSRNGNSISEITINIRNGYNNRLGNIVNTITSATASSLSLLPGTYTFELSKDGYTTKYQTVTVLSTTSAINLDLLSINTASTENTSAFATIIVRWGANPSDVDSHLLFDSSGNHSSPNTRIYYSNKSFGAIPADKNNPCATAGVVASLDLDDTSSYGPETTTICDGTKGPFEFNLHHFSGYSNMGQSPTSVELITRNGSRYEFTAPTGFSGQGDIWAVFKIDENQVVTRVNEIPQSDEIIVNYVTTSSLSNKTYKIVDTNDGSYVVYSFNANNSGTEIAYTSSGTVEDTENFTWQILGPNKIRVTATDETYQDHVLYNIITNGAGVSVLNQNGGYELNGVISNYSDISATTPTPTNLVWESWPTSNPSYNGTPIITLDILITSFTNTSGSNWFAAMDNNGNDIEATLSSNGNVVNVSGHESHGSALHGSTVLGSWDRSNNMINITMNTGEKIHIRLGTSGVNYVVQVAYE